MSLPVRNHHGYTLIEILLVVAVIGILITIGRQTIQSNLPHVTLDTVSQRVISDVKHQQLSAITGETPQSGIRLDYSVRFEEHRYILYPGLVYVENNPENTIVTLDNGYIFTGSTIPSSELSFSRLSGDIRNYVAGQNSVKLVFTQTNESRLITINNRGVISVQ